MHVCPPARRHRPCHPCCAHRAARHLAGRAGHPDDVGLRSEYRRYGDGAGRECDGDVGCTDADVQSARRPDRRCIRRRCAAGMDGHLLSRRLDVRRGSWHHGGLGCDPRCQGDGPADFDGCERFEPAHLVDRDRAGVLRRCDQRHERQWRLLDRLHKSDARLHDVAPQRHEQSQSGRVRLLPARRHALHRVPVHAHPARDGHACGGLVRRDLQPHLGCRLPAQWHGSGTGFRMCRRLRRHAAVLRRIPGYRLCADGIRGTNELGSRLWQYGRRGPQLRKRFRPSRRQALRVGGADGQADVRRHAGGERGRRALHRAAVRLRRHRRRGDQSQLRGDRPPFRTGRDRRQDLRRRHRHADDDERVHRDMFRSRHPHHVRRLAHHAAQPATVHLRTGRHVWHVAGHLLPSPHDGCDAERLVLPA